ncbi:hypothetical protein D9M71_741270 [compost metagenome]
MLCSLQGIASARQLRVCSLSLLATAVAVVLNQSLVIERRRHLPTSGQVLVRSWFSVVAVTTILQSSQVDMAQSMIMLMSADLPMPCPDATAMRSG